MSSSPSATLCYGIDLPEDVDIDGMDLDIIKGADGCNVESYGFGGYYPGRVLLVVESVVSTEGYYNRILDGLPVFSPEWPKILKAFCEKHNLEFTEPKWHLLAYYG